MKKAFSLVELSIVLVILGLLVGGVLAGQSLIRAAEVRSGMVQVEQYNVAVRAFQDKYMNLPGDLHYQIASRLGLTARNGCEGGGNANGMIVGYGYNCPSSPGAGAQNYQQGSGETVLFWMDLSKLGFIEGSFNSGNMTQPASNITASTSPAIKDYLPLSKLGSGTHLYVYTDNGSNWINMAGVNTIFSDTGGGLAPHTTTTHLKVMDAYVIDKKIDDGLPQSGAVIAKYAANYDISWAVGWPYDYNRLPSTVARAGSATTCYDNNNTAGAAQQYSVGQNNGNNPTCALAFKMR